MYGKRGEYIMRKTIGILILSSWIPFMLGMAFADYAGNSPWYMITGFMWLVFGTWAGILLVNEKK
jgi:F0F1-type ATP synthase assembly protein I